MSDPPSQVPVHKRCDVFDVPGRGPLCGPALLLPAFGKCGTNAVKDYSELHPNIRWPQRAETLFDPDVISPVAFVAANNPGVIPSDSLVWMAKAPVLGDFAGGRESSEALAARLLRAYPSAAVLLVFCDPELQPFRWYRHYVTRSVSWDAHVLPEPATCPGWGQRSVYGDAPLSSIAAESERLGGPNTVIGLYAALMPLDNDCRLAASMRPVADGLCHTFRNGGGSFYRRGDKNVLCKRIRRVAVSMDDYADAYASAGYRVASSLDAVYMEDWEARGKDQMLRVLRLAGVDESQFPWERTNGFAPVYAVHQGEKDDPSAALLSEMLNLSNVPRSIYLSHEAQRVCCSLGRTFGRYPTWPSCASPELACHPAGAPPPLAPPLSPPGGPPMAPPMTPPRLSPWGVSRAQALALEAGAAFGSGILLCTCSCLLVCWLMRAMRPRRPLSKFDTCAATHEQEIEAAPEVRLRPAGGCHGGTDVEGKTASRVASGERAAILELAPTTTWPLCVCPGAQRCADGDEMPPCALRADVISHL